VFFFDSPRISTKQRKDQHEKQEVTKIFSPQNIPQDFFEKERNKKRMITKHG